VPRSIVPRMICVHNEDNYLDPYIAICELSDFLEPKFARILRKYATSL